MPEPRILILGGGPAGVGAAVRLRQANKAAVTLLEQGDTAGGNGGSFRWRDHRLDYGSHRLHPASDAEILDDIKSLLGAALLDRPRHGRIRLRGRWIHFPLKPHDLLLRLDPAFGIGVLKDMVWRQRAATADNFAAIIAASLGPTIAQSFYLPYAKKIWGADPVTLSGIQARRRVAAGSFAKLLRKVLNAVPGFRPPMSGRFFYPADGFGQISEAFAAKASQLGADVRFGWRVTGLTAPSDTGVPWIVRAQHDGVETELAADYVWSTLPISLIARFMGSQTSAAAVEAATQIRYRAMILVYLELPVEQFTEFDAHYLPDANVRITRLSEPKNYAVRRVPAGRTVLCAELPASVDDPEWRMDDAALGALVCKDLETVGIPVPAAPTAVTVRRLAQAYPIYDQGYERPFSVLDQWADALPRFLTYGRVIHFPVQANRSARGMASTVPSMSAKISPCATIPPLCRLPRMVPTGSTAQ
ncbi:MAG: FAD-dependent oxidoreductase [Gemmatimonadaceae bacterium]|nr:FAD-dependent oxidoreductase [Gemmatimonadaceae bacterium]